MIGKVKIQNSKFCILSFSFALCALNFALTCYAQEITILYTGETHAMLYPCNCPKEPDGGVSRRATLIKQLRKDNPNTLLLDSGGFFAGGLRDEYTQNSELDRERTIVNLKAMELMKYDAITVGDDEFNFGKEFFQENINKTNLSFTSCNLSATDRGGSANNFGGKSDNISPYILKEVAGTKIGIVGVTSLSAMEKAEGIKFIEPKIAVKQAIEELKKNGADIIVLLSHLGEDGDLRLIKEIEGIDIVITGHTRSKEEPSTKIDSTLVLRPSWQGRRLGKLSLTIKENKITDYKVEELRLSDKIRDDPDILSILPACFSDANCKKKDLVGVCQDPGTLRSRCLFTEPSKVNLLIITPKVCNVCNTETMVNYLKGQFPGLVVSYLYYPDTKANKLVEDFGIRGLPVYLLGKEIEKERGFDALKENLEIKGDFYMLRTKISGISYLIDRKRLKGKLDIFISLYDKDTAQLLDMIEEFNPTIHFLAIEQQGRFDAAKGNLEVEEYLRAICINKYYPQIFWNYISCRGKSINSSWWEDCLLGMDTNKIKICARSEEGNLLLKENISLNKELQIMFGPTYLLDNQEIFGIEGIPTKEGLKEILKREDKK